MAYTVGKRYRDELLGPVGVASLTGWRAVPH
jgi:hypothetical protein